MKVNRTEHRDVVEIAPQRHGDERGYFAETFRDDWFKANIADITLVQENQSLSSAPGTVRGLHFQSHPSAQGKLVQCIAGSIFDVAVDIRMGSPDFGKWVGVTLSAELGNQLWIPPGFLHGFCTLEPACVVAYKVSAYYDRDSDRGVMWDDPAIGIDWPAIADPSHLSPKDTRQPLLRDLPAFFSYRGA